MEYSDKKRLNEEEIAENDKRGIDNPELNRDKNNLNDKDRDFDEETESEDENDDFHTNGIDEERPLNDDEGDEKNLKGSKKK